MIGASSTGSFEKTERSLLFLKSGKQYQNLDRYGRSGVDALAAATPVDTGRASHSWKYQANKKGGVYSISWLNTDVEGGVNVIILLQYGHGTGTGGYVPGRDFVNPAIKPIMDKAVEDVWRQVKNA